MKRPRVISRTRRAHREIPGSGHDLRAQGYSVYLMDHRSQGSSDRLTADLQMGYVDSFQNYVNDVDLYVQNFIKPATRASFSFDAFDWAAIATMYLAQHPGIFQAAAFSSPMFALNATTFPKPRRSTDASSQCTTGDGKVFAQGQGDFQAMLYADAGNVFTRSQVRFDIVQQLFTAFPTLETGGVSYALVMRNFGRDERARGAGADGDDADAGVRGRPRERREASPKATSATTPRSARKSCTPTRTTRYGWSKTRSATTRCRGLAFFTSSRALTDSTSFRLATLEHLRRARATARCSCRCT